MKTWKIEMITVATILIVVNYLAHKLFSIEILAALAVLVSFGHTQISARLAEKEAERLLPEVECYKKMWYYFVGKEMLWLLYFFYEKRSKKIKDSILMIEAALVSNSDCSGLFASACFSMAL